MMPSSAIVGCMWSEAAPEGGNGEGETNALTFNLDHLMGAALDVMLQAPASLRSDIGC
jgi:hypothetical protein